MPRWDVRDFSRVKALCLLDIGQELFPGRVPGPGTGCPEQLGLPLDPWQCPRPGWTLGLGAAWDSGSCPCPWQGWGGMVLNASFHPKHSKIPMRAGTRRSYSGSGITPTLAGAVSQHKAQIQIQEVPVLPVIVHSGHCHPSCDTGWGR